MDKPQPCDGCEEFITSPDECVVGFWKEDKFFAWAKSDEETVVYCLSCVPCENENEHDAPKEATNEKV